MLTRAVAGCIAADGSLHEIEVHAAPAGTVTVRNRTTFTYERRIEIELTYHEALILLEALQHILSVKKS